VLHSFQKIGLQENSHLILFLNDEVAFVDAYWAAQYGGMVPVPLAVGSSDEHRRKVFNVFSQLDDAWLYTSKKNLERLQLFARSNPDGDLDIDALSARTVLVDDMDAIDQAGTVVQRKADDVAMLQFSSGSTGSPKGVVLTHRNLIHNLDSIISSSGMDSNDGFFSWLPLTHDMGIIGFHLTPVRLQVEQCIMPTDLFVRRPLLWLEKAASYSSSILGSPNFGYKHYLSAADKKGVPAMDLSSVRLIFNGAEPISIALARRFMQTLEVAKLPANSMFPVYGLAEASLAATFSEPGAPMASVALKRGEMSVGDTVQLAAHDDPQAVHFVDVGTAVDNSEVLITGDAFVPLAEQQVGHVCIRGDNVTAGYYKLPELNAQMISADGWLDTGDLGFIHQGHLFITGRMKELIIVNGQNFYPHDLEGIGESIEGIDLGKIAVAAVSEAGAENEKVAAFVVSKSAGDELAALSAALRTRIVEQTGVELDYVLTVRAIPKTTSGKFQRTALAAGFAAGEFEEQVAVLRVSADGQDEALAGDTVQVKLTRIVRDVITGVNIEPDDNLFEAGTSSLALAQIHEQIDEEYPDLVDVADLFDHPSINELAAFLEEKLSA
jgi:acyl-CoA synthetase (AMP-forming)/AMP-acid ligase II